MTNTQPTLNRMMLLFCWEDPSVSRVLTTERAARDGGSAACVEAIAPYRAALDDDAVPDADQHVTIRLR